MFFQLLIYVFIIIGGAWLLWKFVIKEIVEANKDKLEARGIRLSDPEPIVTPSTKRLEKLKEEYAQMTASKDASLESVTLAKEIAEMEELIAEANKKIRNA